MKVEHQFKLLKYWVVSAYEIDPLEKRNKI